MRDFFRIAMIASFGLVLATFFGGIAYKAIRDLVDVIRERDWGAVVGLALFLSCYLSFLGCLVAMAPGL
jgi:hypothetical protein